jgi:hypothetical protein
MQLQSTLFALLSLAATLPAVSAATFNKQFQVWDIGRVNTDNVSGKHRIRPVRTAMACGGIPKGGYACGSFEDEGVDALRAIYRGHDDGLQLEDTCYENDEFNCCAKNGRRRGKRFFPFASANRIVCQSKSNVEKP